MKITICGCRYYKNYKDFCRYMDDFIKNKNEEEIILISGNCSGTDKMAERYAMDKGYEILLFPAEWSKYGRAAGPLRNRQMADMCDLIIAFWDGKSKGTRSMVNYAAAIKKEIHIKLIT